MSLTAGLSNPCGLVRNCLNCDVECPASNFARWSREASVGKGRIVRFLSDAVSAHTVEQSPFGIDGYRDALDQVFEEHVDVFDRAPGVPLHQGIIQEVGASAAKCLLS